MFGVLTEPKFTDPTSPQSQLGYHEALLPTIRAYIALRYKLAGKPLTMGEHSSDAPLTEEPQPHAIQSPNDGDVTMKDEEPPKVNGHAADGLEEGSSKSVSEELPIAPPSVEDGKDAERLELPRDLGSERDAGNEDHCPPQAPENLRGEHRLGLAGPRW